MMLSLLRPDRAVRAALPFTLAGLLVAGLGAAAQAGPAADQTGFQRVSIPLIAEEKPDARDSAVSGYLFMPEGSGKFPAAVLIHGCNGYDWTVLVTLQAGLWHLPEHFAAGIAFCPYCYDVGGFSAPLLILVGDADDWTPAWRCRQMVEALHGAGEDGAVELKVFPGAYHAYDFPVPARTNALGHFMRYDAAATAASWQAIDAFLAAHLR